MSAADEDRSPVDRGDRWVLPVGDGVVTQLQIDFAFGLSVEAWLHFRIETPFRYGERDRPVEYDPEDSPALCPLLELHQAQVLRAEVFKHGRLDIAFADGQVLTVASSQQYEAFQVTGERRGSEPFRLIAIPGGGLAEWT